MPPEPCPPPRRPPRASGKPDGAATRADPRKDLLMTPRSGPAAPSRSSRPLRRGFRVLHPKPDGDTVPGVDRGDQECQLDDFSLGEMILQPVIGIIRRAG